MALNSLYGCTYTYDTYALLLGNQHILFISLNIELGEAPENNRKTANLNNKNKKERARRRVETGTQKNERLTKRNQWDRAERKA